MTKNTMLTFGGCVGACRLEILTERQVIGLSGLVTFDLGRLQSGHEPTLNRFGVDRHAAQCCYVSASNNLLDILAFTSSS